MFRPADVLNNLKWKTLETRRFHTKATFMYKILNDLSALPPPPPPQLSNSFVNLSDTNINYNLRNIETDLALLRAYTNFLKRNFKNSGAMLWNNPSYEAKTAQSLSDFKHNWLASSPSMPSTGSHWFNVIYFLFEIHIYIIVTCLPTPHLETSFCSVWLA